jgi:hypothetical protein
MESLLAIESFINAVEVFSHNEVESGKVVALSVVDNARQIVNVIVSASATHSFGIEGAVSNLIHWYHFLSHLMYSL